MINLSKTSKTFKALTTEEIEIRFYNALKEFALHNDILTFKLSDSEAFLFPQKEKVLAVTQNSVEKTANKALQLFKLFEDPLDTYLHVAFTKPAINISIAFVSLFRLDVLLNKIKAINSDIHSMLIALKEKLNKEFNNFLRDLNPRHPSADSVTAVIGYFARGADPNHVRYVDNFDSKSRYESNFELAIKSQHKEIVNEFIKAGASVNCVVKDSTDIFGRKLAMTPLMHAAERSLEIVEILITANAKINVKIPEAVFLYLSAHNALFHALGNRKERIATFLIQNGAHKTNLPIYHTALSMAAADGLLSVVEFLLTNYPKSCGINTRNPHDKSTPLMNAIENRYPKIVERLLVAGADPTLLDENGCTAIETAEQHKESRVEAFKEDFNAKSSDNEDESLEDGVSAIEADFDEIISTLERFAKPRLKPR